MQLRSAGADDEPVAVLRRAVELGVDHLDTAQFYGDGVVNRRIRTALAPYPEHLVVVTKVGATSNPGGEIELRLAQRPEELRAQVEDNLRSLGVERLDVVNLRRADAAPGLVAEGDQVVDLDDQLATMTAMRDEGKLGAIGLSHVSADQLRHALPVGIVCVQNAYSLVDRTSEPVLDLCREHDIAWVPYFPLGGGWPGLPQVTDLPGRRRRRRAPRRHPRAGRPRVAAGARPADPAHPRHPQRRAPRGEPRGGRRRARRGDDGHARRVRVSNSRAV